METQQTRECAPGSAVYRYSICFRSLHSRVAASAISFYISGGEQCNLQFACKDAAIADPLDVGQWEFYVLGTKVLNERVPNQKSVGLSSLKSWEQHLCGYPSVVDMKSTVIIKKTVDFLRNQPFFDGKGGAY